MRFQWFCDQGTYHSFTVTSMIPSPMSDSLNWTIGPRLTAGQNTPASSMTSSATSSPLSVKLRRDEEEWWTLVGECTKRPDPRTLILSATLHAELCKKTCWSGFSEFRQTAESFTETEPGRTPSPKTRRHHLDVACCHFLSE